MMIEKKHSSFINTCLQSRRGNEYSINDPQFWRRLEIALDFSRYRGRKSISFPRIFLFSKIRNGVARKSMNDTTRDTLILVRRTITLRSRRSIRCTNASADSSFGYYLRGNRCRPIVNSSIPFYDGRSFFASRWKHDTCLSIDWNRG